MICNSNCGSTTCIQTADFHYSTSLKQTRRSLRTEKRCNMCMFSGPLAQWAHIRFVQLHPENARFGYTRRETLKMTRHNGSPKTLSWDARTILCIGNISCSSILFCRKVFKIAPPIQSFRSERNSKKCPSFQQHHNECTANSTCRNFFQVMTSLKPTKALDFLDLNRCSQWRVPHKHVQRLCFFDFCRGKRGKRVLGNGWKCVWGSTK